MLAFFALNFKLTAFQSFRNLRFNRMPFQRHFARFERCFRGQHPWSRPGTDRHGFRDGNSSCHLQPEVDQGPGLLRRLLHLVQPGDQPLSLQILVGQRLERQPPTTSGLQARFSCGVGHFHRTERRPQVAEDVKSSGRHFRRNDSKHGLNFSIQWHIEHEKC